MHNEFLKYGSETLLMKITKMLIKVFNAFVVPNSWKDNLQIPIPKLPNPRAVEDTRREMAEGLPDDTGFSRLETSL